MTRGRSLQRFAVSVIIAPVTLALAAVPASAQNAFWSLQGEFANATDSMQVYFDLSGNGVSSSEIFYGSTWGHSGGTNAVGDGIAAGGFNPILSLFESLGPGAEILRGQNDDGHPPPNRDSLLTWPGLAQGGSIGTDPLAAGNYRMSLTAYELDYPGGTSDWAMDLLGPWVPMTITGFAPSGGASIQSFKFGGGPSGGEAWLSLDAAVTPAVEVVDELVVGTNGVGRLFINEGTTLSASSPSIGGSGDGYATISGPGAALYSNFLYAGSQTSAGSGYLTVDNVGQLQSYLGIVGSSGSGSVIVNGPSAAWDTTLLGVGADNSGAGGVIDITQGGHLTVAVTAEVGGSMGATGQLSVQTGGQVTVGDTLWIRNTGTLELLEGDIHTGSFLVDEDGTFTHEDGTLTVDGGQFTMESGMLTIDGGAGGGMPTLRLENDAQGFVEYNPAVTSSLTGIIEVGPDGRGRLEVVDGADLVSLGGFAGYGSSFSGTGEASVLVQGSGSTWEVTAEFGSGAELAFPLQIGGYGTATLEIRDGAHVISHGGVGFGSPFIATIPVQESGMGSCIVDGVDSLLRLEKDPLGFVSPLGIGWSIGATDGSSGALTISNQARVEVIGRIDVQDSGTLLLTSGGSVHTLDFKVWPGGTFIHEDGTLTVDGGTFDPGTAGYTISGAAAGDEPMLELVNGATASFTDTVQIGRTGDAVLCVIGDDGSGTASRFVAGGGIMDIGWLASGRLEVLEGGRVDHTGTFVFNLGVAQGASGFVTVDGPDSQLNSGGLMIVGDHGEGNLGVTGGGRVTASRMWIAHFSDAQTSNVLVSGEGGTPSSASTLQINGSLFVSGEEAQGSGVPSSLSVAAGGDLRVLDTLKVWPAGTLHLDDGNVVVGDVDLAGGRLEGNGSIIVGTGFRNAGTIAPGLSAGSLAITGSDYEQDPAGTLEIEIGSTNPAKYDKLVVITGAAMLAGTLDVSLIDPTGGNNPFQPALGDSFEILFADGGIGGAFAHELLPDLGSLLAMRTYYGANAVTLAVVPALAGDYNGNGTVDAADYVVWRKTLGQTGAGLAADGTGQAGGPDGVVDQLDYDFWRSHFGQTTGGGASVHAAVPEPTALVLMILLAVGWSLGRHVLHRPCRQLIRA